MTGQAAEEEIVTLVRAALDEILGAADPRPISTAKIIKWDDRFGTTVNITRQSKRTVTVWVTGPQVLVSGKIDLDKDCFIQCIPPKNSNCSACVRSGPTIFVRAKTVEHIERFKRLLTNMEKGKFHMNTLDLATPEEPEAEDDEALELAANQRRVLTQSRDESIEALVSRIRKGRLVLQPEFQRDYVWSRSKASALIESILMRIPLPVIYVAELHDGVWEVVDGQQRLTAIRSFIDGRFPDGSPFRLGQLRVRADLRNKAFADLEIDEQNSLEDYSLRVIMIQKEASEDLKFEVFERLNSGADKLNDMELRNCIYRGPYNELLKSLSKNEHFLKIRGASIPDVRMQDRQLVLRFFAMWRNTHLRYRGPMTQFMNHEMQEHRFDVESEIEKLRKIFEQAIQCAWDVFGERAFRRYTPGEGDDPNGKWEATGKLNIALWDTLMYVFTYYERRQIIPVADALREEFLDMFVSDPTFVDYIGRTTDKPDRVRYRAEAWKSRVDRLVSIPAHETRNFSSGLKKQLYISDPSCRICQQQIQSVDDAEVDHIKHYWRGGATIPSNARLTHRFCNRVRGGGE